jgi:hypothetical protein
MHAMVKINWNFHNLELMVIGHEMYHQLNFKPQENIDEKYESHMVQIVNWIQNVRKR